MTAIIAWLIIGSLLLAVLGVLAWVADRAEEATPRVWEAMCAEHEETADAHLLRRGGWS